MKPVSSSEALPVIAAQLKDWLRGGSGVDVTVCRGEYEGGYREGKGYHVPF
jgi:hypothetical protein